MTCLHRNIKLHSGWIKNWILVHNLKMPKSLTITTGSCTLLLSNPSEMLCIFFSLRWPASQQSRASLWRQSRHVQENKPKTIRRKEVTEKIVASSLPVVYGSTSSNTAATRLRRKALVCKSGNEVSIPSFTQWKMSEIADCQQNNKSHVLFCCWDMAWNWLVHSGAVQL